MHMVHLSGTRCYLPKSQIARVRYSKLKWPNYRPRVVLLTYTVNTTDSSRVPDAPRVIAGMRGLAPSPLFPVHPKAGGKPYMMIARPQTTGNQVTLGLKGTYLY